MQAPGRACAGGPTRCSWRHRCVQAMAVKVQTSPHSVFAKRYLVTRPGTVFCSWKPLLSDHQTQELEQLLHTIYGASFFIHFIWHFIGKGYNSYFSLVGGVPMKLQIFSFTWWIFMTQAIWTRQNLLLFLSFPYYPSCAQCYMWCANNILTEYSEFCFILKWELDNI